MGMTVNSGVLAGLLVFLAGAAADGRVVSTPDAEPARLNVPELEPGWQWELEPVPVMGHEFARFVPSGALTATIGGEQTLTVLHVRNKDLDLHGARAPEFRVYVVDNDGEPHQRPSSSSMGRRDLALSRYHFRDFDEAKQVAAIGLAVLTFEGRQELSAMRAKEAAEQGVDVLPLPVVGEPLPFDLPLVDGGRIRSEDLKGKVVLFDGWATWCHPCMMKMPKLKEVLERHGPQGLVVIGLNFDQEWERAEKAIEDGELDWAHVHCSGTEQEQFFWNTVTGMGSLPRLFIVDRDGILREDAYPHDLEQLVKPYLEGEQASH